MKSATLVIAYFMKFQKLSFSSALKLVKGKRKEVCPNLGFERQLKKYESHLRENPLNYTKTKNYSFPMISKNSEKEKAIKGRLSMNNSRYQEEAKQSREVQRKQSLQQYIRKIAEFRFGLNLQQ